MKPITKIYIPFVEVSLQPQCIMDLFYNKEIATISIITFAPSTNKNYRQAILEIYSWHDTDYAYNIIMRLNKSSIGTLIEYLEKTLIIEIYNKSKHFHNIHNAKKFTNSLLCNVKKCNLRKLKTNKLGNKILQKLVDEQEWRNIEIDLFNNNVLENLRYDLGIN